MTIKILDILRSVAILNEIVYFEMLNCKGVESRFQLRMSSKVLEAPVLNLEDLEIL
jgi:hypothetical protein